MQTFKQLYLGEKDAVFSALEWSEDRLLIANNYQQIIVYNPKNDYEQVFTYKG